MLNRLIYSTKYSRFSAVPYQQTAPRKYHTEFLHEFLDRHLGLF